MPTSTIHVGLMSGTSMDGIDAVAATFADGGVELLRNHHHPWPSGLRERLREAAAQVPLSTGELAELDSAAGEVLAEAALVVLDGLDGEVQAIGSHGQTLAHRPAGRPPSTLQIGNPAIIAERTGITTVADFRRRDLAAGGQGAPLVPAFHEALFRSTERHRVVLNIGGIANITCLPSHLEEPVTGFDTGPGNCLMDAWVRQQTGQAMDENGRFAASGEVSPTLLEYLLADAYFRQPPPKSTGTEYFSLDWLSARLPAEPIAAADVQATLLELTARSIAAAIDQRTEQVLVCGGGAHNPLLMQRLDALLPCPVVSTAVVGLPPDWVEAAAFAWLARQTLAGRAGNLPAVTGATGPRILGAIYPA